MANMVSKLCGNVIVTLHSIRAPTNQEWENHLSLLRQAAQYNGGSLASCRSLVFSDGGMPDSVQRQTSTKLIEQVDGKRMKIAIITASSVTKGIITIAKWFGLTMSAYGPREINEAIAFLQLSSEEQRTVQTEIFPLLQLVPCSVCEAVPWATKR